MRQKDSNGISIRNIENIIQKKFKTNLTNAELSLFAKLFFDVVTESNYNKSDLSRLLSNSFETKNTKSPSEKKLYQLFTKVSPETKEKIKDLIFQMKIKAQK